MEVGEAERMLLHSVDTKLGILHDIHSVSRFSKIKLPKLMYVLSRREGKIMAFAARPLRES